jgi:hypothetical protein
VIAIVAPGESPLLRPRPTATDGGRSGTCTRDFCFAAGDAWRVLSRSRGRSLITRCCCQHQSPACQGYAGHESTLGPILIAVGFGIACVTLAVTTIGGRHGWIAGALIGGTTFLAQVPSQCAMFHSRVLHRGHAGCDLGMLRSGSRARSRQ